MPANPLEAKIFALERPDPALWKNYILRAICSGPAAIVSLPYLYFRYHTLRYRFDNEGIHMKVGILFRTEINLTYARIQDIHLRSGLIQRWLGLADVQVQTASGSSGPELTIEGFKDYNEIRDFLYTRMRGYQNAANPASAAPNTTTAAADSDPIALLKNIRDELARAREAIESQKGSRDV